MSPLSARDHGLQGRLWVLGSARDRGMDIGRQTSIFCLDCWGEGEDHPSLCLDCLGSMWVFTRKLERKWLLGMETWELDGEPGGKVDMSKALLAGLWHGGTLGRTI